MRVAMVQATPPRSKRLTRVFDDGCIKIDLSSARWVQAERSRAAQLLRQNALTSIINGHPSSRLEDLLLWA